MSNTPIFDALLAEYDDRKCTEILKTLSTPFMSTVKPPLPKRSVAQLIQVPEPDPEFAKQLQEFIQTAPMQILEGTPAGSFIKSMDVVKDDDTGELMLEAEVMVPPVQTVQEDVADTVAIFNGMRPKLAWVDEWQSGDPDEDEIYVAPSKPITFDRVETELKTDMAAEAVRARQLALYQHGIMKGREKAAQLHDDRFVPPMTEKTMPSWIADEVRESNEALSDSEADENVVGLSENIHMKDLEAAGYNLPQFFKELVEKFRKEYPDAENVSIHRKEELDGTITISVTGTTPEQTDESVNAASNNADSTSTVKPLWVSHEE
ncbi:hypothetical protein SEA_ESKETIT_76 [Streptomyces phage Esketit]|uniref:Uncharacterized protein n=10 Tax=Rimavirus rima TaxID=2560784 RepID=A0A515MIW0_9CAUD|nr:hypothetical protein FDH06_gp81 [Streptomyces phage Rima]AOZ64946.1 hypothetical protein SEA_OLYMPICHELADO_82 [Streptomyces phage OlympicHelado]ASU04074.1 hypothetical protein SEA_SPECTROPATRONM_79 [Streptomyces phage Spectropatronm]QAY16380.1 hypothetical protein SEA_NAMO_82 [Streptomyces phage Namo]QDM56577.1 hypothetical protein SEA_ESKETIT_76 [Streptomyces phage Esketit]QEQ93859.1 hypothetical protein SEA_CHERRYBLOSSOM_80 [Streptomyces phage CherryBlossom]QEQ94025.1 hypothetical protei